jgi:predicted nucleic acid-binding protein
VLDCSVATKWFVPEPLSELALPLLEQLQAGSIEFVTPESFVAEFGHTLRRLVLGGEITAELAHRAIGHLVSLPIRSVDGRSLAPRALALALSHMATFYDSLYVALAEREGISVITADDRMANAFSGLDRIVRLRDLA